jgi:hypothetical protein
MGALNHGLGRLTLDRARHATPEARSVAVVSVLTERVNQPLTQMTAPA